MTKEIHVTTKTSRDTFVQIEAGCRRDLVAGVHEFIGRETAKGLTVTWGSDATPLATCHAGTAPQLFQGRKHVATLRIRR